MAPIGEHRAVPRADVVEADRAQAVVGEPDDAELAFGPQALVHHRLEPPLEDVQRDQLAGKRDQRSSGNSGKSCTSRLAGDVRRCDHTLRSEPHQQLARHGISAAERLGSVGAHVPATDRGGEAPQRLEVLA